MPEFKFSNHRLLHEVPQTKNVNHGVAINRNSRPEVFCKKGVLRNFAKFTGKHLCQSLFFNKVAGLRPLVPASGQTYKVPTYKISIPNCLD